MDLSMDSLITSESCLIGDEEMSIIDETNRKQHIYPTYARNFITYRWYKPIITGVLFVVLYVAIVFGVAMGAGYLLELKGIDVRDFMSFGATSYDNFNIHDWQGSLINLGAVVLMLPALFLARALVRERPFSSYSSARGGWDMGVFLKCFAILFPIMVVFTFAKSYFIDHENMIQLFHNKFTILSFVLVTVLGPLQCIAEEYIYRGLLMQAIGSWVRVPVIAVILQAALFAASHPYNTTGKLAILASGTAMGLAAWIGRGLEVSSAVHAANNMTAFYLVGFSMGSVGTNVTTEGLISDIVIYAIFVIILLILRKTTHIFDRVKKEDADRWNYKIEDKRARRAAKVADRTAKKEGSYGKHDIH